VAQQECFSCTFFNPFSDQGSAVVWQPWRCRTTRVDAKDITLITLPISCSLADVPSKTYSSLNPPEHGTWPLRWRPWHRHLHVLSTPRMLRMGTPLGSFLLPHLCKLGDLPQLDAIADHCEPMQDSTKPISPAEVPEKGTTYHQKLLHGKQGRTMNPWLQRQPWGLLRFNI